MHLREGRIQKGGMIRDEISIVLGTVKYTCAIMYITRMKDKNESGPVRPIGRDPRRSWRGSWLPRLQTNEQIQ